jgi:basic amino acid/polyamine antiporter, APA family
MKLKKDLGFLEVFCISAGAMISSGLFVLIALAYMKTGPSLILSYVLASILILPTVLSKSELATALPRTGGIFVFSDRSMGPLVGTLAGLAAWFSLAFKTAFALLGMGIIITLLNPGLSVLQIKLIAIACCVLFTIVNIFGVKFTGRVQVYMVFLLFILLGVYVIVGIGQVDISRFSNFMPFGFSSVLSTAGFVFISFAGSTKVIAIAGEVKKPGKNIPKGIILAWLVVSIVYVLVIFTTVGVLDASVFSSALLPISVAGNSIMGKTGLVMMTIAALLAFITTGNAGILAASRDPMAMGKADLIPFGFSKISRWGTPWVAILFTSMFMILIMLFLDLEMFIKTASTLKLLLFIIANLAVIVFRKGKSRFYKPTFKAPFFPWIQILGIISYCVLIIDMGFIPVFIALGFATIGLLWYAIYAHRKVTIEYSILRVIKKIAGIKNEAYMFDEEYREIFVGRDEKGEAKFENKIKNCLILDLKKRAQNKGVFAKIATDLASKLNVNRADLYKRILVKKRFPIILGGVAILFLHIKGRNKFEMALIRNMEKPNEDFPSIPAVLVIAASFDEELFYLRVLKWIVQITRTIFFDKKWRNASDEVALRTAILSTWRNRETKIKNIII